MADQEVGNMELAKRNFKNTKSTGKNMIIVLGAMLLAFAFSIYGIYNYLENSKQETAGASANVSGRIDTVERGTGLTQGNTTPAISEAIARDNAAAQQRAQARGQGQVDSLSGAKETVEKIDSINVEGILKEIAAIKSEQQRISDNLVEFRSGSTRSRQNQRADIPRYIGLDGIEYVSEDYLTQEASRMDDMWDRVAQARSVSLEGNVTNFRTGSPATDRQQEAFSNVGVDRTNTGRTPFTRNNGVRAPSATNSANSTVFDTGFGGGPDVGLRGRSTGAGTGNIEVLPVTGKQEIGRLDLKLNSAIGGPVQATVLSGPYQGAILFANRFEANRQYIVINFTRFCLPPGLVPRGVQSCGQIDAYAVDLGEQVTAVAGKFRSYYGIRLIGATGAAFVQGLGRAFSTNLDPGQIITNNNVVNVPRNNVSVEEASNAALLEVGTSLAQTINELSSREPTTTTKVNKNIGILIISPGIIRPTQTTTAALQFGDDNGPGISLDNEEAAR